MIWHMYVLQMMTRISLINIYQLTLLQYFFLSWGLKIHLLSNFQMYNMVLFVIVITLYIIWLVICTFWSRSLNSFPPSPSLFASLFALLYFWKVILKSYRWLIWVALGCMNILAISIVSIHECKIFFDLFLSSSFNLFC